MIASTGRRETIENHRLTAHVAVFEIRRRSQTKPYRGRLDCLAAGAHGIGDGKVVLSGVAASPTTKLASQELGYHSGDISSSAVALARARWL